MANKRALKAAKRIMQEQLNNAGQELAQNAVICDNYDCPNKDASHLQFACKTCDYNKNAG